MALVTSSSGTTGQTAGGAETDIATINAVGKYRLKLDLDLLAAGDVIYIRRYMIVKTGGASNLAGGPFMFAGADGTVPGGAKVVTFDEDWNDLAETDALQYTIEQPFGTTRALPYAVIKEDNSVTVASGGITTASFAAGAIDAAAIAANAIGASELAADAVTEIADGILDRNMATGTDSGSTTVRTPRQALRAIRNKAEESGGTLTVFKEDDSTASWTAAVTRTSADAISAIDPAGP